METAIPGQLTRRILRYKCAPFFSVLKRKWFFVIFSATLFARITLACKQAFRAALAVIPVPPGTPIEFACWLGVLRLLTGHYFVQSLLRRSRIHFRTHTIFFVLSFFSCARSSVGNIVPTPSEQAFWSSILQNINPFNQFFILDSLSFTFHTPRGHLP